MAHTLNLGPWYRYPTSPTFRGSNPYNTGGGGVATEEFSATPVSESQINLGWDNTNYPQATGFVILRATIGGLLTWSHVATVAANVTSYSDTSLTQNTEYVYSLYIPRSSGTYNYELAIAVTLSPSINTVIVNNNSEFLTATSNSSITDVRLAAGSSYTSAINGAVSGKNRLSNKQTIRADDPENPPTLTGVQFSLAGTKGFRFYHLNMVNTGGGDIFAEGASPTDESSSVQDCSICYTSITGPDKSSIYTNTTPNANFDSGMPNVIDFQNYRCKNNTIFGNDCIWVRQFANIRPNGNQLIAKNRINYWYFDNIRLLGQGEEGRAAGNTYLLQNGILNNLAVYEEETASAPHADVLQVFNVGGSGAGTNPCIDNFFASQNWTTQNSALRGNFVQGNLCQSNMKKVVFHENMMLTHNAPHAHWFDAGARGVLISKATCGSVTGSSEATVRVAHNNSTNIKIVDSIIPGGFADGTVTATQYDSVTDNNYLGSGSSASETVYTGPLGSSDEFNIFTRFVPVLAHQDKGALTPEGIFRGSLHVPACADPAAQSITNFGSGGRVTLTTLTAPTLNSPVQAYLGGTTYTINLRYAATGTASWTTVTGVTQGQQITCGTGTKDFQLVWVNAEGEGVYCDSITVTVT